jgi:predicted XRE-type DNA-binding protein
MSKTTRNDSISRHRLARLVRNRIDSLGLNREQAAVVVGDAATQMSRLYTGHVEEFSTDRLVRMLLRLGCEVRIQVGPPSDLKHRKAEIVELQP